MTEQKQRKDPTTLELILLGIWAVVVFTILAVELPWLTRETYRAIKLELAIREVQRKVTHP